jgi:hypothetical protein
MQEPENFSSCHRGTRVHLRGAAFGRGNNSVGPALGQSRGVIAASTIDNDDLERPPEYSHAPQKIVDQRRLIQDRNDYGNKRSA